MFYTFLLRRESLTWKEKSRKTHRRPKGTWICNVRNAGAVFSSNEKGGERGKEYNADRRKRCNKFGAARWRKVTRRGWERGTSRGALSVPKQNNLRLHPDRVGRKKNMHLFRAPSRLFPSFHFYATFFPFFSPPFRSQVFSRSSFTTLLLLPLCSLSLFFCVSFPFSLSRFFFFVYPLG